MTPDIAAILAATANRQYPLPQRPWQHYQRWDRTLMLHWKIEPGILLPELPEGLELDLFGGCAYVSLFAFSVKNLRPRYLPALPPLSDFHEINLRTYVLRDGKPGIYFLSIEAEKWLPALLARYLLGLPYKKSKITRHNGRYKGLGKTTALQLSFQHGTAIIDKDALDLWLTERHCLYDRAGGKLFRIDIHHRPWKLYTAQVSIVQMEYPFARQPELAHYNDHIDVLVWSRDFINNIR